jgi:5S rRNA maturation endonuclease (ribonuclease M5)
VNLQEALEAAGIEVRSGASAEEIWMCCPFCQERGESPDGRFRLGVNLRSGKAQCFNCQWKGRGDYTFSQIQKSLATGEIEAAQELRKHKHHKEKPFLPNDFERLRKPSRHHTIGDTDYWNDKAYKYVRSRGVSEGQIDRKHIGYSLIGDMAYRAVFPVYVKNKLKGLVGRDITGRQEIPYRNSVGEKTLYNLPDKGNKTIVLLEGIFDALIVEQAAKGIGIDACALLGHDLADSQIELLQSYRRIILWLDPDEPGVKGIVKIARKLHSECKDKIVRVVLPKWYKHPGASDTDPDELERSEIVKRLSKAVPFDEIAQLKLEAAVAFLED